MTSSPHLLEDGHLRFLRALAAASLPSEDGGHSIGEMRRAAATARSPWRSGGPDMHAVREHHVATESGSVRLRIYYPVADRPLRALVYLHGGGWALLDLDTHDRIMREYACATGWAVVGIDYPRAPETQFPGAIESCVSVLRALGPAAAQLGLLGNKLALSGDSSGANLALALAIRLRDQAQDQIGALVLSYGVYDCDLSRPSYVAFGKPPFTLTAERMEWFWDRYCPDPQVRLNPLASPIRADLRGLPPVHLITAGQDVLRDENVAMIARLIEAGNSVSVDHYPRAPHAFLEALAVAEGGRQAIHRAARWLNDGAADDRLPRTQR